MNWLSSQSRPFWQPVTPFVVCASQLLLSILIGTDWLLEKLLSTHDCLMIDTTRVKQTFDNDDFVLGVPKIMINDTAHTTTLRLNAVSLH